MEDKQDLVTQKVRRYYVIKLLFFRFVFRQYKDQFVVL